MWCAIDWVWSRSRNLIQHRFILFLKAVVIYLSFLLFSLHQYLHGWSYLSARTWLIISFFTFFLFLTEVHCFPGDFSDLAQHMVTNIEWKENWSCRNESPSQRENRIVTYCVLTALGWCPDHELSLYSFVLLSQGHEQDNTNSSNSLLFRVPSWSFNFCVGT